MSDRPPALVPSAELERLFAQLARVLGGGDVFLIHKNPQGGYALAGRQSTDILDALAALGGGVASLGLSLGEDRELIAIGRGLIQIADRVKRARQAQKDSLQ